MKIIRVEYITAPDLKTLTQKVNTFIAGRGKVELLPLVTRTNEFIQPILIQVEHYA